MKKIKHKIKHSIKMFQFLKQYNSVNPYILLYLSYVMYLTSMFAYVHLSEKNYNEFCDTTRAIITNSRSFSFSTKWSVNCNGIEIYNPNNVERYYTYIVIITEYWKWFSSVYSTSYCVHPLWNCALKQDRTQSCKRRRFISIVHCCISNMFQLQ